jgi:hypothetical protein
VAAHTFLDTVVFEVISMTIRPYQRVPDPIEAQIETLSCAEHVRAQALGRYRFSEWVVDTVWGWLSSAAASGPVRTRRGLGAR